jgi:hypothetical protein
LSEHFTVARRSHPSKATFLLLSSRTAFDFLCEHHIAMAAPEIASDPGAGWDEAQCSAALAQLEQLQAQVRSESISAILLDLTHPRSTTCD